MGDWKSPWPVRRSSASGAAAIRTFKPGGGEAQVQVEARPGHPVTLPADGNGRTYRLRLELTGVQVEATPAR